VLCAVLAKHHVLVGPSGAFASPYRTGFDSRSFRSLSLVPPH
jgi:hypothetical protein